MEEIARCISSVGSFYVLVPTEGGLAVEIARSVTSSRNARILGISARSAVSSEKGSLQLGIWHPQRSKEAFHLARMRYWPFIVGGAHINLAKMWMARPLRLIALNE